tara:strand:+ start:8837 stop:9208 length:372 start_codon:yes stop_codon:yes gene_type:complete
MLRTNSKKYLDNIQTYLLNAIDGKDYGIKTDTPKEKLDFLFDCFESEFNYKNNQLRYPNFQNRFANWLQGLPSAINIPYQYNKILELSKNLLEVDTLSEKLEDQIIKNYWSFMAYHIIKLKNK